MLKPCSGPQGKRKRVSITAVESSKNAKSTKQTAVTTTVISPIAESTDKPKGKAIFVLENAAVKKGFVKKKPKILYAGDDGEFLRRQNKNLDDYRPDILYEALRAIQDSPIYKIGMVGGIYVKIEDGALFEVKPHVRLPRTLERFCGILLELLEKSCVRTKDKHETLLRIIKGPVTRYLPENSRIIGLSYNSENMVDIEDYVSAKDDDLNLVFVVGVMVRGKINREQTDDFISVSNYPLSAKYSVRLICEALREKWNVF